MSCPTSTHTQKYCEQKYKLGVLMGADSVKARQSPEKTKPKAFSEKLKNSSAPGNLALVTGRGGEGKSIAVPFLPARVNAVPPALACTELPGRGLPPRREVCQGKIEFWLMSSSQLPIPASQHHHG